MRMFRVPSSTVITTRERLARYFLPRPQEPNGPAWLVQQAPRVPQAVTELTGQQVPLVLPVLTEPMEQTERMEMTEHRALPVQQALRGLTEQPATMVRTEPQGPQEPQGLQDLLLQEALQVILH